MTFTFIFSTPIPKSIPLPNQIHNNVAYNLMDSKLPVNQVLQNKVKETLQQKWTRLFGVDKTSLDCFNPFVKIDYTEKAPTTLEEEKQRKSLSRAPTKQRDIYTDLEMGYGASSYMFDFLDDTLRTSILNEFQSIVQNAKSIEIKDQTYEDPYHLATILNATPKKKSENKEEENKEIM